MKTYDKQDMHIGVGQIVQVSSIPGISNLQMGIKGT